MGSGGGNSEKTVGFWAEYSSFSWQKAHLGFTKRIHDQSDLCRTQNLAARPAASLTEGGFQGGSRFNPVIQVRTGSFGRYSRKIHLGQFPETIDLLRKKTRKKVFFWMT
jgi:hypothetical protein